MTARPDSTARRLRKLLPFQPKLAVVLGSGFQPAMLGAELVGEVPYQKLPGFPRCSVPGHAARLRGVRLAKLEVLLLSGRAHFYEGWSMAEVTFPMQVLAQLGVEAVLLTNAAGAINPRFKPGEFMALSDHINLMGTNPLRPERPGGQPGFLDLSQVYDPALTRMLLSAARRAKVRTHSGTYLAVSGPSYETPAEIRAFARLGGDAVGMSTVPEAIVARQCGLRVAGLSCLTNFAAGLARKPISHAEVLAAGRESRTKFERLLLEFVRRCARELA